MARNRALAAMATPSVSSHSPMPLRQAPRASMHPSAANYAAILRIQHLFRASAWAASAVPSLGAFLGARLASTSEAFALPLPNAFFCKRCESVLLPGDNCSLQIKIPSRKKHKPASYDPIETERSVYKCGYCGFENVKVEHTKYFKSANLRRTITASKDTENPFQNSPHVTPRASTKTPDSYSHIETPSQSPVDFALTDNSTGTGKKRKRRGWLSLSERTKQSNEQSPHTGKLSELAGAGRLANRIKTPRFESLESLDMQFGNRDTVDIMDIVPQNNQSPCLVPQSRTYDLQEENPSNLATVSFPPELLVVEPTKINFDTEMNLDQTEACQNVSISEAIINTVNISASISAGPDSISGVPSEHNFAMGSELQIEQHHYKMPPDGVFEIQKVLVIDPETSEKDVAAACHEVIEPLVDYKSSVDLPEPKPLREVNSANMPIAEQEKQMDENMHIDKVDFKVPDANNSGYLKTLDIMAVDTDAEISDQNAIYSQNESLERCSSEKVKQLPEVSEGVLSAIESGQLAYEGRLMGVGVQQCLSLQEVEAPHEARSLIEAGVQCCLSPKEVEVPREASHLATLYKQRARILSRNLERLTRAYFYSRKLQIARHFLYAKNSQQQMQVQLLAFNNAKKSEVEAYRRERRKYEKKLHAINASRKKEKSRACMLVSKGNPSWRESNKISIASMLNRITTLKRRLHVIPKLKQQISNLSAQIMHLNASTKTSTDELAVERRASDVAGPLVHVRESTNLELYLKLLTSSPRNSQKEQMEPHGGVEASCVHPVMKLETDGSDMVPTIVDNRIEQDLLKLPTLPEQMIEGLEQATLPKALLADHSKHLASSRDNLVLDARTPHCFGSLSTADVDSLANVSSISEFDPLKSLQNICTELESLKPSPVKLPVSMSQVMQPPLSMSFGHQIQRSRFKRRKVYLDNAIWNCLQARFPNLQPGERAKARTYLYKLGRKWHIGIKWRKCPDKLIKKWK